MRPDIKQEWISRLRSDIPQTRGLLGKGDARCALGVLCDIAVDHGVTSKAIGKDDFVVYGDTYWDVVPPEVDDWVEIGQHYLETIADMNDRGVSFAKIAEFIDEHL
jgi:hypothetical protein